MQQRYMVVNQIDGLRNAGTVRNNMYKGNLTRGQLINIIPWFDNMVLTKLTGQCILDALEF